jgi:predicted nucleic acid-binding protein
LDRLLVDTGFLVAYGLRNDPFYSAANRFLKDYKGDLVTAAPVIVETCFFFGPVGKRHLLEWVHQGSISVVDVPVASYPDLSAIIGEYSARDMDLADAALVWLAVETGLRRILTVDERDFGVYRLKGGKRFEVIPWTR